MLYKDLVRDFAHRTKKNLEAIETLQRRDGEATERFQRGDGEVIDVTQLVNSMLGLLVFPKEKYVDKLPPIPLQELREAGWPIPEVTGKFPQATDLKQLIHYLRNAVAHFNIEFPGDGNADIEVLRVWNTDVVRDERNRPLRNKDRKVVSEMTWEATLTVKQLRIFATRFIDLLLDPSMTHNAAD
jgi:HEPN pEK499 p136